MGDSLAIVDGVPTADDTPLQSFKDIKGLFIGPPSPRHPDTTRTSPWHEQGLVDPRHLVLSEGSARGWVWSEMGWPMFGCSMRIGRVVPIHAPDIDAQYEQEVDYLQLTIEPTEVGNTHTPDDMEAWSIFSRPPPTGTIWDVVAERAWGWPWPMLRHTQWIGPTQHVGYLWNERAIKERFSNSLHHTGPQGMHILSIGLMADTAIFSAALWLLWYLVSTVLEWRAGRTDMNPVQNEYSFPVL